MTKEERIAKVKEELKEIFGKQTFIDGSAFIDLLKKQVGSTILKGHNGQKPKKKQVMRLSMLYLMIKNLKKAIDKKEFLWYHCIRK